MLFYWDDSNVVLLVIFCFSVCLIRFGIFFSHVSFFFRKLCIFFPHFLFLIFLSTPVKKRNMVAWIVRFLFTYFNFVSICLGFSVFFLVFIFFRSNQPYKLILKVFALSLKDYKMISCSFSLAKTFFLFSHSSFSVFMFKSKISSAHNCLLSTRGFFNRVLRMSFFFVKFQTDNFLSSTSPLRKLID